MPDTKGVGRVLVVDGAGIVTGVAYHVGETIGGWARALVHGLDGPPWPSVVVNHGAGGWVAAFD